ncbi:putative 5-formyltetrahydrofolate cyclo-ligase [Thiorhodovibrio winogradskyi]|uniref:5-formyltetrahydrofolate cyclo-ligase n=1 Tax=Thiorhodovibrio winogradskyi TaxID=77007 RepID=A0ABZ0SDV6_9GAMM|nr:5-formyltetrahydrofolate cyclo-ligase [Thiorhodovibrio winogradskyi]
MPPSLSLRRALRARRRALTKNSQRQHAHRVATRILRLPGIRRARRIALYVAADGELDPTPIRDGLSRAGVTWYLPAITSVAPPRLAFYADRAPNARRINRFGIPEPDHRQLAPIKLSALDLVLLPLVGFDRHCQRIGMGLGFYDRCFGDIRSRLHWSRRPRLIGLAHECQRLEQIDSNHWDVVLDAVITEANIYHRDSHISEMALSSASLRP